jgi:hypothetical protein
MSAETKEAMENAIAAHIEEESPGSLMIGFVLCVKSTNLNDPDKGSTYGKRMPDTQDFDISMGLVDIVHEQLKQVLWSSGE